MAPIVPGLTDEEIPALLKQAKAARAQAANYIMLRLPQTVETVFFDWLQREKPNQAVKVESLIRQIRNGETNSSEWGERMTGTGVFADQVRSLFKIFCAKYGLQRKLPKQDCSLFQVRQESGGQLRFF